ncbi:cutinase family protein [Mycobacterium sp. C3-094]|uniref:cutinase family protein n=1 Tax=Mycobacterium sp. PSTR-4-N TaxID=2917745 RepID=UPI001F14E103|nr:cutinase family protein [Mycobacterium sp. PSTR-4-N]MCG7592992.1 cutinase family protein [Mycobacterium sp. PSTR-4-N]
MRSDRLRRLVVAAAAAALPLAGSAVLPVPAASAQPCSDVEVIFARGTSEPPGIGRVGQALTDALNTQLGGRSVSTYAVNYPASYDFLNTAVGATDAAGRIASLAAQCPNTRIVLGGYSQGAAVVDMLAGVPPLGNKIGEIGSAPPLASGLVGNVDAVAVFGNPAAKFGNPVSGAGAFAGKAIDLCADGDPICSDGRNPFAHTHYETSPFIGQAAGFAAARV